MSAATTLFHSSNSRTTLGPWVFDVLGKIQYEGRPLRDILIQAIRYGERLEIRARLAQAIANAVDSAQLQSLLEERAPAHDVMDVSRVARSGGIRARSGSH